MKRTAPSTISSAFRAVKDLREPLAIRQHLPAIHHDGLPSDKGRFIAREKQRSVRDVLHRSQPPLRDRGRHASDVFGAERFHAFRQNVARQHRVHCDVVRRQLNRRGSNEAKLSGLARRVVTPAGIAGNGPSDRRRNDNASAAARLERRQACAHRQKSPFEIDVEHLIPVRDAHRTQPGCGKDAGIATDDIDAAVTFHRRPRHAGAIFGTRNIGRHRACDSSGRPNLVKDDIGLGQIARRDQNTCAFAGEHAGHPFSDSFTRAGNDDRAVRDSREHNQTILADTSPFHTEAGAIVK